MPEPVPIAPAAGTFGDTAEPARPDEHERSIGSPAWRRQPGLVHGTTLRSLLPEPGKPTFFETLRRARDRGAFPSVLTFGADQVHGVAIASIRQPLTGADHPQGFQFDPALNAGEFAATDALITSLPGVLLVIQTADCLPVFYHDPVRKVVGLAHCGWRGLHAGLAGAMIPELLRARAELDSLRVWLGPCIGAVRYEVGARLVADFAAAFPGAPVSPNGTHLDLPAVARWQLERAGLPPAAILESAECTAARPDRYHSWRLQAEGAGRMLSFIGLDL